MCQPTKEINNCIVKILELRDDCPVYKVGDILYAVKGESDSWVFDLERSKVKYICISALPSLIGELVKVRHKISDKIYISCLDPGPPYSKYSCVFEITREEL